MRRPLQSEPPPPEPTSRSDVDAELVIDVLTTSGNRYTAVAVFALIVLLASAWWWVADRHRDRFPTGGFAVDWLRARGRRFSDAYLRW